MKFKEIRSGHPIYILNKKTIELTQESVTTVGQPYYSNNGQMQKVIDVNVDGITYVVPEESCVSYAGDKIISTTKDGMACEVNAIRGVAENIVNSYESSKDILLRCNEALEKLDDRIAEKRQYEKRIDRLEEKINELISKMS